VKKMLLLPICLSLICTMFLSGCTQYDNMGTPSVSVNGKFYNWTLNEEHEHFDSPPEGYEKVSDEDVEYHFFAGGEGVWVNSDNPDVVYVYTDQNHRGTKKYCKFAN